ncbi:hypothetical protein D2T29_22460 [Sinirhodobacter populi]|uniref:DNA-binding protein n=1 Tax=Paenirhodobacter populi TaxID=2306993 RepID=A0A443JWQ5_9RHOB|nr:hypothetical protein [Sinirhodobacter populi]RWR24947.1 hypothetical protein D2T29_22460 [Sinirhodobacter populi]
MMPYDRKKSFDGKIIALPGAGGIAPGELCRRLNVTKQAMRGWRLRDEFPVAVGSGNKFSLDANTVADWLSVRGAVVVRY